MTTTPETTAAPTSLLRHRAYWRWSAAAQFARLAPAMAPLAFTLLTTAATGSYRLGAVMMVAFVIGELAGAIPAGRLLDALGPSRGARVLLWSSAGAVVAVTIAVTVGGYAWVLLGLTAIYGAVEGGLSSGLRSLLAGIVPDQLLLRATSVDAMVMEGVIVAGPALVVLLGVWDSTMSLVAMVGVFALSALILPTGSSATEPAEPATERVPMPWRQTLCWLACLFTIGHLLSTLEVGALPLAQRIGEGNGTAVIVIALLSAASIAGSAVVAWRGRTTPAIAIVCLMCFALGGTLVALDLGWPGLLAGLVLVGVCTGPLLSLSSISLQRVLPERRRSEGFSFAYVVQSIGFATGSFSLGVLPLELAVALGVCSALVSGALVATLVPPSSTLELSRAQRSALASNSATTGR